MRPCDIKCLRILVQTGIFSALFHGQRRRPRHDGQDVSRHFAGGIKACRERVAHARHLPGQGVPVPRRGHLLPAQGKRKGTIIYRGLRLVVWRDSWSLIKSNSNYITEYVLRKLVIFSQFPPLCRMVVLAVARWLQRCVARMEHTAARTPPLATWKRAPVTRSL